MRIGIYGGTFNPIHRGHLTAARAAMDVLGLDRLLLIPASVPPHKALPQGSAEPADRLEMTALACAQLGPGAQALDIELHRTGPSYTVDTLRQLRQMYPEDELWLLMGTDMFLSLERWYHAADILSLAHIGAFDRVHPQPGGDLAAQKRHLEETYGADIAIIPNEHVLDLSSTQVRQALAQGGGQELVTDPVYGYIQRRGLYGVHTDLRRLTPDRLRPIALSYLKPKRMPHVLGTEQEAVRLARQYGADETQARVAALLHDSAKEISKDEMRELMRQYPQYAEGGEERPNPVWHGICAAILARTQWGVEDEAILSAIACHTAGKAGMSKLDKVVYLADMTSKERDWPGVGKLRKLEMKDLDAAMLAALKQTNDFVLSQGKPLDPQSAAAYEDILAHQKKEC